MLSRLAWSPCVQGLSFAIPIDDALKVNNQIVEHGAVRHARREQRGSIDTGPGACGRLGPALAQSPEGEGPDSASSCRRSSADASPRR